MLRRKSSSLLVLTLTATVSLFAQNRLDAPEFDIKGHYTKY